MHVTLINVEVFRANKKLVCFILRELERVNSNIDLLILMSSLTSLLVLLEHAEMNFRVIQLTAVPLANLAIIRDTDDIISILGSYH